MENEKKFESEMENLLNQSKNLSSQLTKSTLDMFNSFDKIVEKDNAYIRKLLLIIMSDVVDSYDKLIAQRKECIDKYVGIYSLLFQDDKEIDLSKPVKSLMEKQHNDIDAWQKEIAPLIELKKCGLDESTSDEKANEIIASLMNV